MSEERVRSGNPAPEILTGNYIRRLCVLEFQCPLCGNEHRHEAYISLDADNLDDYVAALRELSGNASGMAGVMSNAATDIHQGRGDLEERVEWIERYGVRPMGRPPTLSMTPESEYTCDRCGRIFENVRGLRKHMRTCRGNRR